MAKTYQHYYVPEQSPWPIVGAVALFLLALGAGHFVNEVTRDKQGHGEYMLLAGVALLLFMLVGWFRNVIDE
jgi:cytochrome c oxidase subunit 3